MQLIGEVRVLAAENTGLITKNIGPIGSTGKVFTLARPSGPAPRTAEHKAPPME